MSLRRWSRAFCFVSGYTYFPWDLTLMPVSIMVLLQIKPTANPWLKAIVFALFASYAAEYKNVETFFTEKGRPSRSAWHLRTAFWVTHFIP